MSAEKLQSLIASFAKKQEQLATQEKEVNELITFVHKSLNSGIKTKLAVYGLLNSGKSTLLNVVTNHLNDDFFKTGDRRVTTENQYYETEKMIFIDTPGLDGGDQDDLTASIGKDQANLILFVHNAAKEMEKEEIDLLKNLKQELGDNDEKAIIIVLSRSDSVDPEDLAKVKDVVTKQCKELLDFSPDIIAISSHLYCRATKETEQKRKDGFTKLSQIPPLLKMIEERKVALDVAAIEITKLSNKLNSKINEIASLQQEVSNIRNAIKQTFNMSFNDAVVSSLGFQSWLQNNRDVTKYLQSLKAL